MVNKVELQSELDSLHQILLGIKVMYACAMPLYFTGKHLV